RQARPGREGTAGRTAVSPKNRRGPHSGGRKPRRPRMRTSTTAIAPDGFRPRIQARVPCRQCYTIFRRSRPQRLKEHKGSPPCDSESSASLCASREAALRSLCVFRRVRSGVVAMAVAESGLRFFRQWASFRATSLRPGESSEIWRQLPGIRHRKCKLSRVLRLVSPGDQLR
ncbi:MAG: hypothetical protein H6Q06_816, partial [Acidobacteria bacterium]|nr:hypothetical protein [Acidobacteriota bacterium]